MDQEQDWPKEIAAGIGKRVALYRERRKLSAQQTAGRCAELGMPSISRVVITKLENGRREAVSVAELLVLAAALDVPPIELLIPLEDAGKVEILPGARNGTWDAFKWFTGATGPGSRPGLWESHEKFTLQLIMAYFTWRNDDGAQVEAVAGQLRSIRALMREKGVTPPELKGDTAAIYNAAGGDAAAIPVAPTLHAWLEQRAAAADSEAPDGPR